MMSKIKLVEMCCDLTVQSNREVTLPIGYTVETLENIREQDLYPCYLAAFQAGDSQFFMGQSPGERREFYGTLAFEQARKELGSSMILKDEGIAGFTFLVPYGQSNRHISCMCVHPSFQRQGLGAFMLEYAKKMAGQQDHQSITLWTEADMGAFKLYRQHGFMTTEEKNNE
jgi:ribosomal protein S18 acetylase RimI-like enzyme